MKWQVTHGGLPTTVHGVPSPNDGEGCVLSSPPTKRSLCPLQAAVIMTHPAPQAGVRLLDGAGIAGAHRHGGPAGVEGVHSHHAALSVGAVLGGAAQLAAVVLALPAATQRAWGSHPEGLVARATHGTCR